MTWHTATIATDRMAALLTTIRSTGGTVTQSRPPSRRGTADVDDHKTLRPPAIAGTVLTQLAGNGAAHVLTPFARHTRRSP